MPTADNWKVKLTPDNTAENTWIANAKRDDFEFSQKVQGNEGEIADFCKTARAMYAAHVKNQARAKELESHFDDILEREDKREADEYAAAVAAAAQAVKDADDAAKAKAEADAKAAADAALPPPPPEPVTEPTPADAVPEGAEPIQDAPIPEEPKNETPV